MKCQNCPIGQTAPCGFPPQHQDQQPGLEYQMDPRFIPKCFPSGRTALITGGDSGIGRTVGLSLVILFRTLFYMAVTVFLKGREIWIDFLDFTTV